MVSLIRRDFCNFGHHGDRKAVNTIFKTASLAGAVASFISLSLRHFDEAKLTHAVQTSGLFCAVPCFDHGYLSGQISRAVSPKRLAMALSIFG
ncbi:MAG: hypothetical protein WBQ05_01580 [Candidatus Competibacter denitrificans]